MITLNEAIELATKAHEGQWRRPKSTNYSPEKQHYEDYINEYGNLMTVDTDRTPIWMEQEPYITHPLAVMEMMGTEEEKIVAVLHDVIEDTHYNILGKIADNSRFYIKSRETLEEFNVSENIYKSLSFITKSKEDNYLEYIKRLSHNKLATKVKIADMFHNMSCNPSDKAKVKYFKALPVLLKEYK